MLRTIFAFSLNISLKISYNKCTLIGINGVSNFMRVILSGKTYRSKSKYGWKQRSKIKWRKKYHTHTHTHTHRTIHQNKWLQVMIYWITECVRVCVVLLFIYEHVERERENKFIDQNGWKHQALKEIKRSARKYKLCILPNDEQNTWLFI